MVGMFVCLCLASQKPSEREFFLPAGTHLGVKLLRKNCSLFTYFFFKIRAGGTAQLFDPNSEHVFFTDIYS